MAQMQFKLRMPDPLRAAIEESARRGGTSLNNEIVKRLELSFRQEEQVGGPEVQELTRLWQAAFLRGLALGARARDLADQSPSAALRDVFAYRSAVHAGTDV